MAACLLFIFCCFLIAVVDVFFLLLKGYASKLFATKHTQGTHRTDLSKFLYAQPDGGFLPQASEGDFTVFRELVSFFVEMSGDTLGVEAIVPATAFERFWEAHSACRVLFATYKMKRAAMLNNAVSFCNCK